MLWVSWTRAVRFNHANFDSMRAENCKALTLALALETLSSVTMNHAKP